jgi:predicted dinucleotide-binding enzyme
MKVGIIGAGAIGRAFAQALARSDVAAVMSSLRGPESLAPFLRGLGGDVTAATVAGAASEEMVLLALPWTEISAAVGTIPDWEGRIVIDATNPISFPPYRVLDLEGRLSSEVVAGLLPGAQLVKAFNTLPARLLEEGPRAAGGRRVVVYCGDHARAKAEVGRLVERLGFAGVDLGRIAEGGRLQHVPLGPFPGLDLVRLDHLGKICPTSGTDV